MRTEPVAYDDSSPDAHSEDELRDPTSTAHHQLIEIVRRLAAEPRVRPSIE
jgi:hypothetical protein